MKTRIFTLDEIDKAAELLRRGKIVAFPTETVYGLGANALDEHAAGAVFEAKKRPSFDPLIVHIAASEDVHRVARSIPDAAQRCFDAFWPGPFTAILPKRKDVPDIVTAGLDTVGVRMPAEENARRLIAASGTVVAAPSANLFTHTSPTSAEAVLDMLDGRIDGLVRGGNCSVGVESTIVSFCEEVPVLYRAGGIPLEAIEECIGPVRVAPSVGEETKAPGRSLRHYAPQTPLYLGRIPEDFTGQKCAYIGFGQVPDTIRGTCSRIINLSEDECPAEAARNLYRAIRTLDRSDAEVILVAAIPETGLGRAVRDRLRRAAEDGFHVY
ncbi:MAG: L-threonylcarbamoyladenylate synthase [Fibrobacterota bacterium]